MSKLKVSDTINYTVRKIKAHQCNLVEEIDTASKYIKSGYFIQLRRALKKSMLISHFHPKAMFYAKSSQRFKIEESRHLDRHYYMIHPYSSFTFIWNGFMSIIFFFILTILPLHCIVDSQTISTVKFVEFPASFYALTVLNVFCLIHIIISCMTGYYDNTMDRVVMHKRKIFANYLKTFLILDVASTFQLNMISIYTGLFPARFIYRLQWVLKLPRLISILQYMEDLQLRISLPRYQYKTLKYLVGCSIIFLWMIFITYSIHFIDKRFRDLSDEYFHKVILFAINIIKELFLIDNYKGIEGFLENDIVGILFMHIGKFFEVALLAEILQIYGCYTVATKRNEVLLLQLKHFVRFKDLPQKLHKRIKSYLNFKFQQRTFNEEALMSSISSTLRHDILWHTCQNLITKVETFQELPTNVMMNLVTMIKPEIYLPNDVVVQAGDFGNEMFFIYVGVLAVYTPNGKEICHLYDGTHFGEIALLFDEKRTASVVAIDFCELYRLTKKDFQEAIEPYANVKAKILKAAKERLDESRNLN